MQHRSDLDGIRALAVVLVVASHLSYRDFEGGWIGVDIFFVLSGFLITSILLDEWERTDHIKLGRFYLKRALRLYPALIVMVLFCAFYWRLFGDGGTAVGFAKTAALSLTYTEDLALGFFGNSHGSIGHTWSLAVEEQFYLIWAPLLLFLLKKRWNPVPWIAALIGVSWISLWVSSRPDPALTSPLTYYRPDSRANELFIGCMLAFIVRRWGEKLTKNIVAKVLLAPLGLIGLAWIEVYVSFVGRQSNFFDEEVAIGLFAACLVLGIFIADGRYPLNAILGFKPVAWLGTISYSIYIWFIPVLIIFPQWGLVNTKSHEVGVTIISIGVLVAATCSHYLVERPFLHLKDKITTRTMGLTREPSIATSKSNGSEISRKSK